MSGLQFNLKKNCLYAFAILFSIAITTNVGAHHSSLSQFYSTLTSDTIPNRKAADSAKSRLPTLREQKINNKVSSLQPLSPDSTALDTIPRRDSVIQKIDTFSIKLSKDTLDAPVEYEAEDSAVLLVKDQLFLLYGKTQTTYKDIQLRAPQILLNQQTNILTAKGEKDSIGTMVTRAEFQQGEQKFQSDSLLFNFKTQKGLTRNTYTQEGELFIKATTAKKINANTLFVKEGYYTTCNLDDPHFAFKSNRLKIINNKLAVSGPTHPEFEGVPIPIYLPFGIYPLSQGRHSGLLPPQFTANEQFGLGLEGLGYYHVLNEYLDVTVRGNLYSYGGWTANITPTYRKRYRYNGSFNLALQHTKIAFKGDPDYNLTKTFSINWNHSVDPKAHPGTSFMASVNAGSTRFNQLIPNNALRNVQNQLFSTISYSKQWQGKPYSLQLSANHNQNNASHLVNLTIPDGSFTVTTLYPFQRKDLVGAPKWYEKVGVGYSGVARNLLSFYDTGHVQYSKLLDTLQWGARHSFPISLQLPPIAGSLFLSPSISYEESWSTNRLVRRYNPIKQRPDTVSNSKGLFIDRHMNFGVGFNTNIFGTFRFKNSRVQAIRHVIRPTFGMSYTPNMSSRYYDVIQVDSMGNKQVFPQLQNNLFPGYGYGRFGGMNFAVDNNLEMKWRSKKDTGQAAIKKIRLIDGFGFNSGYNFLSDSLKLLPFNLYLRSTLFEKISLTAQALLDPYQMGPYGDINKYVWEDGFSLGSIRSLSVAMSTNFQSKPRDPSKSTAGEQARKVNEPSVLADQQTLVEYMHRNPAEFVDFNIPWSVNLSFSLALYRRPDSTFKHFINELTSNASFSNSFSLTPKWVFATNGYFDLKTKQLTMFTMSINRDMHCWQMSINVTPIGNFRSFNITINPKASILQDLKVNRTRYFYNY
ncbi:MAG: putative LPS assembly protein LptD [Candidatus Dadabacteria bacterium]